MLVSPFPGASKGLSNNVRRVAAALATGYLSLVLFGRQFNPQTISGKVPCFITTLHQAEIQTIILLGNRFPVELFAD